MWGSPRRWTELYPWHFSCTLPPILPAAAASAELPQSLILGHPNMGSGCQWSRGTEVSKLWLQIFIKSIKVLTVKEIRVLRLTQVYHSHKNFFIKKFQFISKKLFSRDNFHEELNSLINTYLAEHLGQCYKSKMKMNLVWLGCSPCFESRGHLKRLRQIFRTIISMTCR